MPPLNATEPIEVFDDADPNSKLIYWPDERLVRVRNKFTNIDITIPLSLFDAFVETVYGKQQAVSHRRTPITVDTEARENISLASEELLASTLRLVLARQNAELNPQVDLFDDLTDGYEEVALSAQALTIAIDTAPPAQRPSGWGDTRA